MTPQMKPEALLAKHVRGLICMPMTAERVDELELPMMVSQNRASRETAFTISIEAEAATICDDCK